MVNRKELRQCSISGHVPHPPCVVCDNEYSTRHLCEECQSDPANEGWSEAEPVERSGDIDATATTMRLSDLAGRRLRSDSDRTRAILQLVYSGSIRELYRNRGRARGRTAWVWRTRALNLSEIAFLVGCTPQAVRKVLQKALS